MKKKVRNDDGPKIARAYIRVSHQGDRGKGEGNGNFLSPDIQLNNARDYVRLHLPEYQFDEEASKLYMDIDRSASRLKWQKREGLVAHLEAARRKEFDALVFYKLSRFARNAREGLELFDEFEKAGCSAHSVMDKIDTNTAVGKLLRTVLLAIAEMEADNISDWVREAFLKRVQNGLVHGGPPFWVTKNGDGSHVLNDRKNDVRRLIDLRLQGYSHAHIALTLNEEGFQSSLGRKWTSEKVRLYLAPNKLMLLQGHFTYGQNKDDGDPGRIIIENAFPAVITEDEAAAINAFNRQQRELWASGNPRKAARTSYILSGLIRCAGCGGPLRSRTSGKPSRQSYLCRNADTNQVHHPAGHSINAELIEEAVLRVVMEVVHDYRKQMEQEFTPKPKLTPANASLEKQIATITDGITRISELYERGHIQLEDFDRRYKELADERDNLRKRLNETDVQSTLRLTIEQAVNEASELHLTTESARRLILTFVERIDAPVEVEITDIDGKQKKCRAAWVTLKMSLQDGTRKILSPIYPAWFKGERVLLDRE